jgi:hypothetical protein
MKTTKNEHGGWIRWNKIHDKYAPHFDKQSVGRWQYHFEWDGIHASLVQISNGFNGNLVWEIWVQPIDTDPVQCGSRNACLHYMYQRMLGLDNGE